MNDLLVSPTFIDASVSATSKRHLLLSLAQRVAAPYGVEERDVLEALQAVDAVIVFETQTPADLIAAVQPDVLVKGGDYDPEASKGESGFIVGSEEVRERGGRVEVIPLLPGRSTTNIIKKSRSH